MSEVRIKCETDRLVGYNCDICSAFIDNSHTARGAIYLDDPESSDWPQKDFCKPCYGMVIDAITDLEKHRKRYPEEYKDA